MLPPASGHSSLKPPVFPAGPQYLQHGCQPLGRRQPLLPSGGPSSATGHNHPVGQAQRPPLSSECSPASAPGGTRWHVGRPAFPAYLEHFLVQDPGAKHDDAVDVDNGVVAAAEEFSGLLFTVQDQGDVLLVDAECDSVPPVQKRTARAGGGSACHGTPGQAAAARRPRPEEAVLVLCTQARLGTAPSHTACSVTGAPPPEASGCPSLRRAQPSGPTSSRGSPARKP